MNRPLLCLLLVTACAKPVPPPAEVAVSATVDTLIVPVVLVNQALPRSDGRWVLLAPDEAQVLIADFAAHTATPFPGMTKAEVPGATGLIGAGDTVIVSDWGLRRFTAWVLGQRLAAWPVPDALRGAFPRARDAAGQWYFEFTAAPGSDGSGQKDSAAIVRADPQLHRFDTLARLAAPEIALGGGNRDKWIRKALSGQDAWGVLADGRLWLGRVFQNRIEWHGTDGKLLFRTNPLPDRVLINKGMDREIYIRRYREEDREQLRANSVWQAVKPPFERIFRAPDDRLWLFKSDTALAPSRIFQVVDSSGVIVNVRVPSRGSALGVDGSHIVMAEEFPGGMRLLRYVVPKEAVKQ